MDVADHVLLERDDRAARALPLGVVLFKLLPDADGVPALRGPLVPAWIGTAAVGLLLAFALSGRILRPVASSPGSGYPTSRSEATGALDIAASLGCNLRHADTRA